MNYLGVNYLATTPKDSGSPLIVEDPDNDRNLQIGIVYGSLEECNDLNYPSLFARLDDYEVLKFIRATAFGDNIPTKVKGNMYSIKGEGRPMTNLVLNVCFDFFNQHKNQV